MLLILLLNHRLRNISLRVRSVHGMFYRNIIVKKNNATLSNRIKQNHQRALGTLLHSPSSHHNFKLPKSWQTIARVSRHTINSCAVSSPPVRESQHFSQLQAATVFTLDTSMVLQTYHQTSEAAILVSATARVVRFASSLMRWKTPLYSVIPWTMLSTVLSRCHSQAVLPGMPLSSSVHTSDALMLTWHKGPGLQISWPKSATSKDI